MSEYTVGTKMENWEETLSGFMPVSSRGFGSVIEISFLRLFLFQNC